MTGIISLIFYSISLLRTSISNWDDVAGQLVGMRKVETNELHYFLTDHLGSVAAILEADGDLKNEQRYKPFGEVRTDVAGFGSNLTDKGYTGQKNVAGTGLMDYRAASLWDNARFYDSYLSRFTQPDTVVPDAANPQTWNRFSYALGNPVKYNDPSGHGTDCGFGENCVGSRIPSCSLGGDQFCILNNGGFIDESHVGTSNPTSAERFWDDFNKAVKKGTSVKLRQSSPGFTFYVIYDLSIPEGTLLEELKLIGAGIWLDFQKEFEAWQYAQYAGIGGNHSSFSNADIPSAYLGYVTAVNDVSYESVIEQLGGGVTSSDAPPGFRQRDILTFVDPGMYKCIYGGSCPATSSRNDTRYLKVPDGTGSYTTIPYPETLDIVPSNNYWDFNSWGVE
jgi:RHS repeat-associated protein